MIDQFGSSKLLNWIFRKADTWIAMSIVKHSLSLAWLQVGLSCASKFFCILCNKLFRMKFMKIDFEKKVLPPKSKKLSKTLHSPWEELVLVFIPVVPNLALVETLGEPITTWSAFFLLNFKLKIYEAESKSGQQSSLQLVVTSEVV